MYKVVCWVSRKRMELVDLLVENWDIVKWVLIAYACSKIGEAIFSITKVIILIIISRQDKKVEEITPPSK